MLRSYVVIALRNLMRDKVVTSINIVGLSVAIAVSAARENPVNALRYE